ncbi:MAG: symmetrical bis(5'-nucleosyl)-tetraphosphatase [Gammaproteobacteria bacterium]|nr:symmetrical bis(5'-nucleosyl)-tetraphosphatase [Gammaproteobacteria bacterium]
MAIYCMGDIQGCSQAFFALINKLGFSPSRDTLFVLGDLVNRGPDNLAVLRQLMQWGDSAQCILGNHDIFTLAVHFGVKPLRHGDTIQDILQSVDADKWIDWLRFQKLAIVETNCLMVHAGVVPQWDTVSVQQRSKTLHQILSGNDLAPFLREFYLYKDNKPDDSYDVSLRESMYSLAVLTRIRFCNELGDMDHTHSGYEEKPKESYLAWYDHDHRKTKDLAVLFGHWSARGGLWREKIACLDTGCVWGRELSVLKFADRASLNNLRNGEWISVPA